uniref:Protein LLP homolog n=1 Tax=Anopheles atroparvus TaxID=41427 RepID=A0A182JLR6_ANOAO
MTARSKKQRNKNKAIKRTRNKVKELKKLKKTLGLIDEDGMDLMEKIKDITEQQKNQEELEKVKREAKEEIYKRETQDTIDHNTYVEVVNPTTNVKHVYNAKTKRDQFGNYPSWYNWKKEARKQKIKEGKGVRRRQFRGRRMHFIDRTCAWKNIA